MIISYTSDLHVKLHIFNLFNAKNQPNGKKQMSFSLQPHFSFLFLKFWYD
jgi:hypothetical protein